MSATGSAPSPTERAAILAQQAEGTTFGGGGLSFLAGPKSRRDNSAPKIDVDQPPVDLPLSADVVQAQPQGDGGDKGQRGGGRGLDPFGGFSRATSSTTPSDKEGRGGGGSLSGPKGGGGGRGGGGTAAGASGAGSPF